MLNKYGVPLKEEGSASTINNTKKVSVIQPSIFVALSVENIISFCFKMPKFVLRSYKKRIVRLA